MNSQMLPNEEKLYIPHAEKLSTELADFYVLDNFLNPGECGHLIEIIKKDLRPSTITDELEGYRTSQTCDLPPEQPLVEDMDRRICSLLGVHPSYGETMQGQAYELGEEFKAHTDYFEGETRDEHTHARGQRTFTFMIYLNEVESGGETEFVHLNQIVTPKQGMAVIWNNLTPDGNENPYTLHQAHPVRSGKKYIITKWFRENGDGPMFIKKPNEYVPSYTQVGFKKEKLDRHLFEKIKEFYTLNSASTESEHVEGGYVTIADTGADGSDILQLPEALRMEIHISLRPILEDWSKTQLVPTFVYGIRTYKRGAILVGHRDRIDTHIISAIINIDQEVEEGWPLMVEDHYYRDHHVLLHPGEVVFYESARLFHGRPIPLKGNKFANIFCHFKPV